MSGPEHFERTEALAPPAAVTAQPDGAIAMRSARVLALQASAGNRAVTRALAARRGLARVPSAPAATVTAPAAGGRAATGTRRPPGTPLSATRDLRSGEAPASAQSASAGTGGSDQDWYD